MYYGKSFHSSSKSILISNGYFPDQEFVPISIMELFKLRIILICTRLQLGLSSGKNSYFDILQNTLLPTTSHSIYAYFILML